jgi:hypothetical protein
MSVQKQIDVLEQKIKGWEEWIPEMTRRHAEKLKRLMGITNTKIAPTNNVNMKNIKTKLQKNYLNKNTVSRTMKLQGIFGTATAKANKNARYGKAKEAYISQLEKDHKNKVEDFNFSIKQTKKEIIMLENTVEYFLEKGKMDEETVAKFKELGWRYREAYVDWDGDLIDKGRIIKYEMSLDLPFTLAELGKADAEAEVKEKASQEAQAKWAAEEPARVARVLRRMQKEATAKRLLPRAGYLLKGDQFIWSHRSPPPDGWPLDFPDDDAVEWAIKFGVLKENTNANTGGRRTRRARRSA